MHRIKIHGLFLVFSLCSVIFGLSGEAIAARMDHNVELMITVPDNDGGLKQFLGIQEGVPLTITSESGEVAPLNIQKTSDGAVRFATTWQDYMTAMSSKYVYSKFGTYSFWVSHYSSCYSVSEQTIGKLLHKPLPQQFRWEDSESNYELIFEKANDPSKLCVRYSSKSKTMYEGMRE